MVQEQGGRETCEGKLTAAGKNMEDYLHIEIQECNASLSERIQALNISASKRVEAQDAPDLKVNLKYPKKAELIRVELFPDSKSAVKSIDEKQINHILIQTRKVLAKFASENKALLANSNRQQVEIERLTQLCIDHGLNPAAD